MMAAAEGDREAAIVTPGSIETLRGQGATSLPILALQSLTTAERESTIGTAGFEPATP